MRSSLHSLRIASRDKTGRSSQYIGLFFGAASLESAFASCFDDAVGAIDGGGDANDGDDAGEDDDDDDDDDVVEDGGSEDFGLGATSALPTLPPALVAAARNERVRARAMLLRLVFRLTAAMALASSFFWNEILANFLYERPFCISSESSGNARSVLCDLNLPIVSVVAKYMGSVSEANDTGGRGANIGERM